MTDVYTRFAMQDADELHRLGVESPAVLHGAPFTADEIEAMIDAIRLIADGGFAITINGIPKDTGPIDFSVHTTDPVDRWDINFPTDIVPLVQAALGNDVRVVWDTRLFAFDIRTVRHGWTAHLTTASAPAAGTDISAVLRLADASDARVVQGRLAQSHGSSTQGIMFPSGDWVFEPPDLVNDEGLETAVVLSLFTDALADVDDALPGSSEDDRRGWWAQPWGSKLWLLSREKWTESVKQRAEYYAYMALQWMIEDQVADRIETESRLLEMGTIGVAVAIYRDGQLLFAKPYGLLWQATMNYPPQLSRQ
jgi:phage gp46-like protein